MTWNILSSSNGSYRLRGCIGNFAAAPIGESLKDYAAIRCVPGLGGIARGPKLTSSPRQCVQGSPVHPDQLQGAPSSSMRVRIDRSSWALCATADERPLLLQPESVSSPISSSRRTTLIGRSIPTASTSKSPTQLSRLHPRPPPRHSHTSQTPTPPAPLSAPSASSPRSNLSVNLRTRDTSPPSSTPPTSPTCPARKDGRRRRPSIQRFGRRGGRARSRSLLGRVSISHATRARRLRSGTTCGKHGGPQWSEGGRVRSAVTFWCFLSFPYERTRWDAWRTEVSQVNIGYYLDM